MDANTKKRYDKAGPQVVKALEKRHFEGLLRLHGGRGCGESGGADPQGAHGVLGRNRYGGRTVSSSGWRKRASPSLTRIRPRRRRSGRRC